MMIKRLLQLSLLFMLGLSAWAGNVTREEAMQKALQFVNKQPRMLKGTPVRVKYTVPVTFKLH